MNVRLNSIRYLRQLKRHAVGKGILGVRNSDSLLRQEQNIGRKFMPKRLACHRYATIEAASRLICRGVPYLRHGSYAVFFSTDI